MHRTFWKQRPHLIHLCLAFIYHSASLTHRRRSANMLWIGKLLHLFWKQAHLIKFLQDALVFFPVFSDFPMNNVHHSSWEITSGELPSQWVMFCCLACWGRGYRALGRGATILSSLQRVLRPAFLSHPKGVTHVEGPRWRVGILVKTWVGKGEVGWGRGLQLHYVPVHSTLTNTVLDLRQVWKVGTVWETEGTPEGVTELECYRITNPT